MNRKLLFGVSGLVLIAISVLVLITSAYSVHQTKTAIVFQFGNPRAVITDPGLHWKLPWRSVSYFEARVLTLDTAEEEILDKNSNRLVVDLFSRYRISDPLKFFQTLQNQRAAANKLSPIIIDSMRGVFAEYSLEAVLSEQRAQIMKRILDTANAQAQPLGVSFVDLRVRRADLPEANAQAIYESMNAERTRDANQLRAEGEEAKRAIVAGAQREVVEITANARQRAQEFRGQGDADAIRIYAEAFGKDPEFYSFYRSMEAYRNALGGEGTTFVLSPESDFFRFFGEMAGQAK
jgi:modulator of FtsH protease HflC